MSSRVKSGCPAHRFMFCYIRAFRLDCHLNLSISLFLSPDGKVKASKRHGATSVKEYLELGYPAGSPVQFSLLLGWNPGNDQEVISKTVAIRLFSLDRVNASPVRFRSTNSTGTTEFIFAACEPRDLGRALFAIFAKRRFGCPNLARRNDSNIWSVGCRWFRNG